MGVREVWDHMRLGLWGPSGWLVLRTKSRTEVCWGNSELLDPLGPMSSCSGYRPSAPGSLGCGLGHGGYRKTLNLGTQ